MKIKEILALLKFKPEKHCSKYADIDERVGGEIRQAAQVNVSASQLVRHAAKDSSESAKRLNENVRFQIRDDDDKSTAATLTSLVDFMRERDSER